MTTALCDRLAPETPTARSNCITGRPCRKGCSLFCALEPTYTEPTAAVCVECGVNPVHRPGDECADCKRRTPPPPPR